MAKKRVQFDLSDEEQEALRCLVRDFRAASAAEALRRSLSLAGKCLAADEVYIKRDGRMILLEVK